MTDALARTEANPLETLRQMLTMPGVSTEAIQTLSALAERWQDRESERSFFRAMNDCQRLCPIVAKDAVNEQTKTRYAKLEKIARVVMPIVYEHGFSVMTGEAECPKGDGWIRVTAKIGHEDGHSEDFYRDFPHDAVGIKGNVNKTVLHARASASSYAQRLLICGIFNVTLANSDDDGNLGKTEPLTTDESNEIHDLLTTRDVGLDGFWDWIREMTMNPQASKIIDIPAHLFKTVRMFLRGKPVKNA